MFCACPCAFTTSLKRPETWGKPCKSDPQTLIQDVQSAASTVWTPLYLNHCKCSLHADLALHTVPKAGGSAAWPAAECKPNALILTWMLLCVSRFPKMKQIWLPISLVLLFSHKTERKFTLGLVTSWKRKLSKAPSTSVLLERSSLLFQASIQTKFVSELDYIYPKWLTRLYLMSWKYGEFKQNKLQKKPWTYSTEDLKALPGPLQWGPDAHSLTSHIPTAFCMRTALPVQGTCEDLHVENRKKKTSLLIGEKSLQ